MHVVHGQPDRGGGGGGGDGGTAEGLGEERRAMGSVPVNDAVAPSPSRIGFSLQLCQCDFELVVKRENFPFFYLVYLKHRGMYM